PPSRRIFLGSRIYGIVPGGAGRGAPIVGCFFIFWCPLGSGVGHSPFAWKTRQRGNESGSGRQALYRRGARLTPPEPSEHSPVFFSPDGTPLVATHNDFQGLSVWDLRRIRQQLAGLGLDWDKSPYPPAAPRPPTPLRVEAVRGQPESRVPEGSVTDGR